MGFIPKFSTNVIDNIPIHWATGLKYDAENKANVIWIVLKNSFETTSLIMTI